MSDAGWQPIGTAPKNRTPVWVGIGYGPPKHGQGAMMIACWCPGGWERLFTGSGPPRFVPTHWKPLPAPPPPEEAKAEDPYARIWQPIETAPKDGTAIDLWCPVRTRIAKCFYVNGRWMALDMQDVWRQVRQHERVTHWMHMPKPPRAP